MKLLVNSETGSIHAASDVGGWQVPDFCTVVDVPGDAEKFAWPHPAGPSACVYDNGDVLANPALPTKEKKSIADLVAEYVAAKPDASQELKDAVAGGKKP